MKQNRELRNRHTELWSTDISQRKKAMQGTKIVFSTKGSKTTGPPHPE